MAGEPPPQRPIKFVDISDCSVELKASYYLLACNAEGFGT